MTDHVKFGEDRRFYDIIFAMSVRLISKIDKSAISSLLPLLVSALLSAVLSAQTTRYAETFTPKEPLEYDSCGNLVPSTVPHIYVWAFHGYDRLVEASGEATGKRFLSYQLKLNERDVALLEDAARNYVPREREIDLQIIAIRTADQQQHPERRGALTQGARKAVQALFAQRDEILSREVDSLRARLGPNETKIVDQHISFNLAKNQFMSKSAPRAEKPCTPPSSETVKESEPAH